MPDYGITDSIVAELIAKDNGYIATFDRAIAKHKEFDRSIPKVDGLATIAAGAQRYADQHNRAMDSAAKSEEQTTAKVTRSRKARTDAVKQAGNAEVQAEIATQQRITKAVEDGVAAREAAVRRGSGTRIGATVPGRADNARQGLLTGVSGDAAATAEVAAGQKEINHLLLEEASLRAAATVADEKDALTIKDKLTYINLYKTGLRANLDVENATIYAEERLLALQKARAETAEKQALVQKAQGGGVGKNLVRFGEGAGLGRAYGSTATVAGIAVAAGAGIAIEAVKTATDYAQALTDVSKAAGISATALQVYQHAAINAGAKSTDFDQAISELSNNLGRARTGSEQQAKAFAALGINIKTAASAGDLMPTLIDRISSISDQSKRAAVETALFGESGRKLDGLLSGGNDKVNELAAALERTGAILSSSDIAKLDDVSKKLAEVKAQLQVDVAQVVAGNADSIESLAKAFVDVANAAGSAIRWIEQFNNTKVQGGFSFGAPSSDLSKANSLGDFLYAGEAKYEKKAEDYLRQKLGFTSGKDLSGLTPGGLDQLSASASDYFAKVQAGSVNNKLLDSLNAPKGRKGPNPNAALNEADERTKRFNDAMARYQDEILAATAQQTSDEEARRDIERDQLRRDEARQIADLKTQADIDKRKAPKDVDLINDRLQQQIKAVQDVTAERLDKINLDSTLSSLSRQNDADNAILEFKNQQLQAQESLAKTAADRRDLELQILANEQQIAKNNANLVLSRKTEGDPTITKADVNAAQRTLDNLPADTASKTAVIDRQTQGPWADYVDKLPTTAKQIDEAFQQAAVSGVERLNDSLDQSISKMLHLHGVAGEFLNDLIKIGLHALEGQLFGGASAGSSGGLGGLGGLLGGFGKLLGLGGGGGGGSGLGLSAFASDPLTGLSSDLLGWADGGSGVIGGNPGVDQNVLSLNGTPIRKVGRGELLSVQPHNAVNPNMRVNSPQVSGPVINQTIRYAGAVDIADRNYVNQVAAAQFEATKQAIGQGMGQAVQASPAEVRYQQRRQ